MERWLFTVSTLERRTTSKVRCFLNRLCVASQSNEESKGSHKAWLPFIRDQPTCIDCRPAPSAVARRRVLRIDKLHWYQVALGILSPHQKLVFVQVTPTPLVRVHARSVPMNGAGLARFVEWNVNSAGPLIAVVCH